MGLNASYYSDRPNRALHTDIASPWATDPTWSHLTACDKSVLSIEGIPIWLALVMALQPHLIIASISKTFINNLGIPLSKSGIITVTHTSKGTARAKPFVVDCYNLNGIPFVNCPARNVPLGMLSNMQKTDVGKELLKQLKSLP
jgi:hypothetical protein